jgi:pimeloyl-ACP methyl ester carboxylesterase
MACFVLIPGAGGNASYWDELVPELRGRGHEAVPVDIQQDDPALGLPEYADVVQAAIGPRTGVVLVAQSLGGFTAPMVAQRTPLAMIVLLNAMIPLPGETPGDWWGATGSGEARRACDEAAGRDPEFDVERHFLHDVPEPAKARLSERPPREPSGTPFGQPCEFDGWPAIPVKVLVGRGDRFFPAGFQRRVARERLGLEADEVEGGHLAAVSNPAGVADRLAAYAAEL